MQTRSTMPRILNLATDVQTDKAAPSKNETADLAKAMAARMDGVSSQLDDNAQAMAQGFVQLLQGGSADPALLDCLQGCCELLEILDELDDFQPQGMSIKQRKQKLEDAVLGLSRLLNTNQEALKKETSLNDLLKFVKALSTAAEANLPKPHAAGSGKFNARLRQQEQTVRQIEQHLKKIDAGIGPGIVILKPADGYSKLEINKNEYALFDRALSTYKQSIDVNTQPQQFGNEANTQLKSMRDMQYDLEKQLVNLKGSSWPVSDDSKTIRTTTMDLLQQQLDAIKMKISVLNDYISPLDASKICHAKANCVAAAQAVLKNALHALKVDDYAVGRQIQKNLSTRFDVLKKAAKQKITADKKMLLGQKKLGFFQQLLHPIRAGRQENLLKARASLFGAKDLDPKMMKAATGYFTEEMLMQAVLEEALKPLGYSTSQIKELLHEQISEVLNSHDWAEIKTSFRVPLNSESAQIMVPVTSTTRPAGNALSDKAAFKILSADSPITQKTVDEFRGGTATDPTIRGINSHCATETTHCTSLATTELTIDGKLAFSATRHGVTSAYDLNPATIQSLPMEKREAVMKTISTGASNQATQLAVGQNAQQTVQQTLPALPDTQLQTDIKSELKKLGIADDQLEAVLKDTNQLANLALQSTTLCQLVKRVANLNRAREAFITDLNHNKKLQAKVGKETLIFNSISLLTPDQIRATKNQITGENHSENERQMLIEQRQAWKDLQNEIDGGGILVNGTTLKAKIRSFNFGVNKGALDISSNPVMGELVSGWDYVHAQNAEGMHALFGDPQDPGKVGEVRAHLKAQSAELQHKQQSLSLLLQAKPPDQDAISKLDNEIRELAADIHVIEQLAEQITQMWEDNSYQRGGNEPYKMVSRMALLSYLLDGGTLFNCKSGKDRTAQLDIETKFLAFQIHTSGGTVPVPDRERTDLEKIQMAVFTFEDESRRTMQEYNTGHGGSKLRGAWALYDAFTAGSNDTNLAIKEYLGASGNAGS